MIAQILLHTPAWVFALFFVLLAFGLMQARTRSVPLVPALLLPAGMVALSLAGIQTSFGLGWIPLACWAAALAVAAVAGYALMRDTKVGYDAATRRFFIPGSWTPLAVIMAIFFAKYVYAVMRAFDAQAVSAPWFVAGLSAVYGLLSGYFAARGLVLVTARGAAAGSSPATAQAHSSS